MNGRPPLLVSLALFAAISTPTSPWLCEAGAQEPSDRFRVLVPDIQGVEGAGRRFGERLADRLRELINDMGTHRPVEEKELKRALGDYDLDMEDLDCVRAKQLGAMIGAQVVFCGTYRPDGEALLLETKFFGASGEEFPVDPITVPRDGHRQAAEHIRHALQLQSDQHRAAQFCGDWASSQSWGEAERACREAVALNPMSSSSRYTLAVVYQKTDRPDEALAEFERVLDLDPLHEEAMQWAGNLSATLGLEEEARAYYERYLELDPDNATVRMRVAYDLALAGDPLGAMQIIEEGLDRDPENVELLKQHGGFAFTAGAELREEEGELTAGVVDLFKKALASYDRAYAVEGSDMDSGYLTRMLKAYLNLGEFEEAVGFGERALQTHGGEAAVWSFYADALQRAGRMDDAIGALDEVAELDPEYPNLGARQGKWLIGAGREDEAVSVLEAAVARGGESPDGACDVFFNHGYQEGVRKEKWSYAIQLLRAGLAFGPTDEIRQRVSFYLGYAILRDASIRQEPRTKETARATLPMFQEARRLLVSAAGYARSQGGLEGDRQDLLANVDLFIEIQEAILKRGS